MSVTLDAIEDRVSPSRMIQRRKNRVAESVHALRDRVRWVRHQRWSKASRPPPATSPTRSRTHPKPS